jgi:hypothetical protein
VTVLFGLGEIIDFQFAMRMEKVDCGRCWFKTGSLALIIYSVELEPMKRALSSLFAAGPSILRFFSLFLCCFHMLKNLLLLYRMWDTSVFLKELANQKEPKALVLPTKVNS